MEIKNLRILPLADQKFGKTSHVINYYDKKVTEAIIEQNCCPISDFIEKLKESGVEIKMSETKKQIFDGKMLETKFEKFGDTIFPVTYGPNGIVIIDYPSEPLK